MVQIVKPIKTGLFTKTSLTKKLETEQNPTSR